MNENLAPSTNMPVQYCILKVNTKFLSSKLEFEVDFGKESESIIGNQESLIAQALKVTNYYTLVDGLNYMSSLGWEIVNVYYREFSGTTYNNPEYLMKKSLSKR
ncbi:hypothetical protein [Mucilaginibacter lacusdianchii]|uniref:hypothetical protein n=1 Tax=Mucilaginibacter lacusdianchii TaxID=2684211 RepID=UPI00131D9726|nr:hypothetical protein [Mucilaginibacter sp. JXJ CY 39]